MFDNGQTNFHDSESLTWPSDVTDRLKTLTEAKIKKDKHFTIDACLNE